VSSSAGSYIHVGYKNSRSGINPQSNAAVRCAKQTRAQSTVNHSANHKCVNIYVKLFNF